MKAFIIILLAALSFASTTGVADEDAHYRAIVKRHEQLQEELRDLTNSQTPDPEKFANNQRQFEQLEKDTYDFTKGEKDLCPVHQIKMPVKEVRIAYGLLAISNPHPDPATRARQFPFARTSIMGGCIVSDSSPKTGKVFVCPKCVDAEKAWMEAHKK